MRISDAILPEFDQEAANTRKTIERVPDDKLDWRPHEKSWPFSHLATHLAEIPGWVVQTIEKDAIDLAPPGQPPIEQPPPAGSRQELLDRFDKHVAAARAAIAAATDEHLMKPWSLLSGGATLLTMPRVAVLRRFVMNHTIHHRAQLGVYLRLNNIPVPSIYGPSADEGSM